MVLSGQGACLAVLYDLGRDSSQRIIAAVESVIWPWLGREANLQLYSISRHRILPCLTRMLGQRTWAAVESILEPYSVREPS